MSKPFSKLSWVAFIASVLLNILLLIGIWSYSRVTAALYPLREYAVVHDKKVILTRDFANPIRWRVNLNRVPRGFADVHVDFALNGTPISASSEELIAVFQGNLNPDLEKLQWTH